MSVGKGKRFSTYFPIQVTTRAKDFNLFLLKEEIQRILSSDIYLGGDIDLMLLLTDDRRSGKLKTLFF